MDLIPDPSENSPLLLFSARTPCWIFKSLMQELFAMWENGTRFPEHQSHTVITQSNAISRNWSMLFEV